MANLKKWFNSTFLRSVLIQIGIRSDNTSKEYEFQPWFEYRISPAEKGYTLYFTKPPSKQRYNNEIFSRMAGYNGHDLVMFLDYHYTASSDKKEFVRFVRYETLERLKKDLFESYRFALETAFEWVKEKEKEQENQHGQIANPTFPNGGQGLPTASLEETAGFPVGPDYGKIALNNKTHLEKFIQVLILLKELQAPGEKVEYMFSDFSFTDMAGFLRQFEKLANMRTNTLQRKISDANNALKMNDPRVIQLHKALQDFFYH